MTGKEKILHNLLSVALAIVLVLAAIFISSCNSANDPEYVHVEPNSYVEIIAPTPTPEENYEYPAEEECPEDNASYDEAENDPEPVAEQLQSTPAPPQPTQPLSSTNFLIYVNRALNLVTVYSKDSEGNHTQRARTMLASVGAPGSPTPVGTFQLTTRYRWRPLFGGVWGQYAFRLNRTHILFHSTPFSRQYNGALIVNEFNRLGTAASMGCIRLSVIDSKWIHDNIPSGTTVIIHDDSTPQTRPAFTPIQPTFTWDPTDPHPSNPWRNPQSPSPTPSPRPAPSPTPKPPTSPPPIPSPSLTPPQSPPPTPSPSPTPSQPPASYPSPEPTPESALD